MSPRKSTRFLLEELEKRDVPSVYYVATTGNDANAGTLSAPFQTLQHAVNTVKPGDTILVETGVYAGCRIGTSGTATAPLTLEAAPGARVLINVPGASNIHQSDIEVESFSHQVNYWTIAGLEVENAARSGIDVRETSNVTIRNCIAHNNAKQGIFFAFSNYPLVQNNLTYSNGQHGIYDSNSGDYPTITGNTSHDNAGCGIQLNGDVTQGGDGIISYGLIANNVLYNNGAGGGSAINCDGVQNSVIENNLLYNNHGSGISLFQYNGGGPSTNNLVVANTIDMASNGRWALNIQNGATGNTAYDNILYDNNPLKGSIYITPECLVGFTSDYNVVLNSFTTGSGYQTLAQWQASTGQDKHSIIAAPSALWVNEAAHNYNLAANSPAIGAGTWQQAPITDLTGAPRPLSLNYDVGALEHRQHLLWLGAVHDGGPGASIGSPPAGRLLPPVMARGSSSWVSDPLPRGIYTLQVRWTADPTRATNATYYVYDGPKLAGTVLVSQQNAPQGVTVNGTAFQSLGNFKIKSGVLRVVLADEANGSLDSGAVVVS
jgi:parallel beta-helix repeat protein